MSVFELSPKEFTALSVLLGFALLNGLDANRQNALGNFLMGIGQVLETAAAQQAVAAQSQPQQAALSAQMKELETRLAALEQHLNQA